jgi:hypothetical protein
VSGIEIEPTAPGAAARVCGALQLRGLGEHEAGAREKGVMSGAKAEEAAAAEDRPPRLEELLVAIAADFDRAATDDERRARGYEQLAALTMHLQRDGVPGDALRPVTALMHALADVDRGNVPPILQTRRTGGGRPVPSDELRQRGLAAAVVTLFMRADKAEGHDEQKLERAVRKAVSRVRGWRCVRRRRVVKTREQSLPEAVKDWRERAMRGRPSADGDACIYARMLKFADDGRPPAEWAEWILTEGYKLYR